MSDQTKAFWLGGVDGYLLDEKEQSSIPAITKLGEKFRDFQNGQWRGEWGQKGTISYGDIRDLCLEASRLLRRQHGVWRPFDSAPQDGTLISVWRKDSGTFMAQYHEVMDSHGETGEYLWFDHNGDDLTGDLPTHWQPLPEGPHA